MDERAVDRSALFGSALFGATSAATTNDHTRRTNLSLVLSLVHHRGVLTRAELARATGLNRSTVGTLIAQLGELGLVYETAPGSSATVGRPSPHVHADPATAALAVNPEVDAVTIGLVGLGGKVIKRIRYETQHRPTVQEVVNIAAAVIAGMRDELDASYRIVGIGVAVPGLVRAEDGMVTYAPHLGWTEEPVAAMLSAATGYPVHASNDASLGAGGEIIFGAGRGTLDLVYLNGGASGIGGGIISGGSLRTGSSGYAGELGHTLVNSEGAQCHCGAVGCLETEVSRKRLLAVLGRAAPGQAALDDAAPDHAVHEHGAGSDPAPIGDNEQLEQALAASNDPAVLAEVERQLDCLAVTLRGIVNVFNPERIVLGGFLGTLFSIAGERLSALVLTESMDGPADGVTILRAQLGSDLLMIGAAELAFSGVLADPAGHGGWHGAWHGATQGSVHGSPHGSTQGPAPVSPHTTTEIGRDAGQSEGARASPL
ncbi:ROK family protein [Plantibacter sp. Mn2098]|uniref:ROK family protein n=1 Tax=Plantibacter sp. Mn2098 TaxID=3395266 RepID=UPI003BCC74AC